MSSTVISDTSCLIFIGKIDLLQFLPIAYQKIYITPLIVKEYGIPVPDWIIIREPTDKQKIIELELEMDQGEATAIALAIEIKDCDLLIDDLDARKYAIRNNLKFTGTLGILLKAKEMKAIERILPYLEKLKQQGLRISQSVEVEVLKLANEI